jgi:hypothetical protein
MIAVAARTVEILRAEGRIAALTRDNVVQVPAEAPGAREGIATS